MKRLLLLILVISLSIMFLASGSSANSGTEQEEKYILRMFAAGQNSMTYASMSADCMIIRNYNPQIWKQITAIPSAGPYAGFRGFKDREAEGTYSQIPQMINLWRDEGVFADNPIPKNDKALLGPVLWTHEDFLITSADRDDLNSIWDLRGKKVSFCVPGFNCEILGEKINEGLDIGMIKLSVEMNATVDSLRESVMDAAWAYVSGGVTSPAWMKELEIRMDAKIIPMTKEEAELVAANVEGVSVSKLELRKFSDRLKGPEIFWQPSFGIFWVFSPHFSEQAVYEVCKALYDEREKVLEATACFASWAEETFELQKRHLDAASGAGIPMHPGLAKWLKENNVWHDYWLVGQVTE